MLIYSLIAVIVFLLIVLAIGIYYIVKFANIIFTFEDDIADFSNHLIDITDRVEQVQTVRALMSHPSAATYISESFEELRYCRFLLAAMIRKSKMLLKKDYTELEVEDVQFPTLYNRLEQSGVYDPEEDGEINIMSKEEGHQIGENAKRIKGSLQRKDF